jgi:DtxR family Mn-dependent transcriptional regulator
VDSEAEALEHAISPRLEQALAAYLGEPGEDPHGHPIPTREGELPQRQLLRLCDLRTGERAVIREAQDDSSDRLRRWRELGLIPGAVVRVLSHEPLDNLFEIDVGGAVVRLGPEALAGLRGEILAG